MKSLGTLSLHFNLVNIMTAQFTILGKNIAFQPSQTARNPVCVGDILMVWHSRKPGAKKRL